METEVKTHDQENLTPVNNADYFKTLDFNDWNTSVFKDIDQDNSEEELQRIRKWVKNERFYRGQQRGFFSPVTGTYQTINLDDYSQTEQSILLVNNQVRSKVRTIAKEWAKSQSKLHSLSNKEDNTTKRASRYIDGVLRIFQRKLIDEAFKQREAKNAILCGNYFRYTYWSTEDSDSYIEEPKYEDSEFTIGDEHWECECGEMGEMDELPEGSTCPNCQRQVKIVKPQTRKTRKKVGTQKVLIGEPRTDSVHPIEIKTHLRARSIRQTPYMRRKRMVLKQILEYRYKTKITGSEISPVSRYALELESAVGNNNNGRGTTTGSQSEATASANTELVEFVQVWLDKPMYFNIITEKEVTLPSGEVIPANTKLAEKYPDGMYLAKVGQQLLDVQNENKNDSWTHSSYDIISTSFWGDGIEDVIQNQQFINEIQSLMVENILHNASPKIIFNPQLIDHELLTGRPREMTPMSISARKDDKPQDAITQLQGMSVTGEAQNALIASKDDMREQMGAFPTMSGMADPHIQTATGMAIVRDSALGLIAPALALKAQMEVEWAYQIIKLLKKHWAGGKTKFAGLLGEYSIDAARAFAEVNVDSDIEIIAEPSSWMPRTDLEVRTDFMNFMTAGGIPMGFLNPEIPFEIREKAAELFRFEINFDDIQPDIRWANIRLETLEEIVLRLKKGGYIDGSETQPEIIKEVTAEIPIDLYIDDHQVYVDTYTKFLKTDKGIYGMPTLRESVKYLILQHQDAMKEMQTEAEDAMKEQAANQVVTEGAINEVAAGDEEAAGQPQEGAEPAGDYPVNSDDNDVATGRESGIKRPTANSSKVKPQEVRK